MLQTILQWLKDVLVPIAAYFAGNRERQLRDQIDPAKADAAAAKADAQTAINVAGMDRASRVKWLRDLTK